MFDAGAVYTVQYLTSPSHQAKEIVLVSAGRAVTRNRVGCFGMDVVHVCVCFFFNVCVMLAGIKTVI